MKKQKSKKKSSGDDKKKEGGKKLGTCKQVKARHILCEKQSKALEAYNKMKQWIDAGENVPPAEFAKVYKVDQLTSIVGTTIFRV